MRRIVVLLSVSAVLVGCNNTDKNFIEASGTIEGTELTVSAEVTGKAKHIRVDEGARVRAGDTLLTIDDTEYQLQLRVAEANLAAAEAQYRLALEGSRREDVVQAEAVFKSANADYNRMKELLAAQSVTQKQYDDTYSRYVSAQQTLEKLTRGLRKSEIDAARARRDQAAAQIDQLKKKVRDCSIIAPSQGIVTLKAIEQGELVTMGSTVVRLTYLDDVKLMIYVSEKELGNVKLGQRADVTIDSAPDRSFEGRVISISPNAEFTPKNVQTKEERTKLVYGVKVEIPNKEGILKPGMPADAKVTINQ